MRRRNYLLLASSTALTTIAGCVGGTGDSDDTETDDGMDGGDDGGTGENGDGGGGTGDEGDDGTESAVSVVERFYELENEAAEADDPEPYVEEVRGILHSKSPLLQLLDQTEESDPSPVTNLETEVLDRDLDADELDSKFGLTSMFDVEEATVESLAQENVIVEATFERPEADSDGRRRFEWLVATENGEWVLFINLSTRST